MASGAALDVAVALVGAPELVFLDEPATGFDPSARREAWTMIEGLKAAGTTVFLTTHDLDEAQHPADRVAILRRGAIVATVSETLSSGSSSHSCSTSPTRSRHALVGRARSRPSPGSSPSLRAVALEDLDRRRLARSVGPEEAEHLPGHHVEVDAPDHLRGCVALSQASDRYGRRRLHSAHTTSLQEAEQIVPDSKLPG